MVMLSVVHDWMVFNGHLPKTHILEKADMQKRLEHMCLCVQNCVACQVVVVISIAMLEGRFLWVRVFNPECCIPCCANNK